MSHNIWTGLMKTFKEKEIQSYFLKENLTCLLKVFYNDLQYY